MFQQVLREACGFEQGGAAQAEGGVDEWRVVEQKVARSAGGTVIVDEGDGFFDQFFGELARVANGCGSQDELRFRAVEVGDAFDAAQDVRHVRAKDTTISVRFVDDDVFQVGEEIGPVGVMRQDAGVEHVGVGEDDARTGTDLGAVGGGRVAVVDGWDERLAVWCQAVQGGEEVAEAGELVLGQRLGGEDVERAGVVVLQ